MNLILNELKKLFGRKQFMLLSAVLLIMQVFTLYAYERNTEEFYYLYEHKDDYEEVVNPISEDSPVTSYEELEASKMPMPRSTVCTFQRSILRSCLCYYYCISISVKRIKLCTGNKNLTVTSF